METRKVTADTGFYIRELEKSKGLIAELEQQLYVARELLQQIHDCPVNWVESTIPKGGMDPDNPKHRGQVVGTQHISYTRLYNIAAFLHQNIEHEKGRACRLLNQTFLNND